MVNKKVVGFLSLLISLTCLTTSCLLKKENQEEKVEKNIKVNSATKMMTKSVSKEKKYDLYSTTPYELPLCSIVDISKLPLGLKNKVDKILEESQGFYLLHFNGEKILIILQNPIANLETFRRHDLQFVEMSLDGKDFYHNAGYVGIVGEFVESLEQKTDTWVFDEKSEPHRPLKHIAYDENKKVKFIETWNYDEKESVKYQMLDSNKKVVSILKETQESDSNYRKEHIFYDNVGNIKMSLVINYDGANISRLTFYNSHESIDGMTILSEYKNGYKTKELVYDEGYKLVNTFVAEYLDDERKSIRIYDSEGKEMNKISSW